MRIQKILFLLLILFTSLISQLQPHGFCAGTKVRTEQGFENIEDLTAKDAVLSYDFKKGYSNQPIVAITKTNASHFIRLWFSATYLDTSPDQLFYLANEKKWVAAKKLTAQNILLKNITEELKLDAIEIIDHEIDLYILTVEKYHNFCVTEQGILVHNILPVVIGAGIVFGGGVEFTGVTVGLCAFGAFLGFKFLKGHKKPKLEFHNSHHHQPPNTSHTNIINPTISISKPETPKKGCGNTQIPKATDHILVTPAAKPEQQPDKGCFKPDPLPTTKTGCGEDQLLTTEEIIRRRDQRKNRHRLTEGNLTLTKEVESQKIDQPKVIIEKPKNVIPDKTNIIDHIFQDKEGHFKEYSTENKEVLESVANDSNNFLGKDKFGKEWYHKILNDGKEIWTVVWKGNITDGGINDSPKPWDPETGLSRNLKK